MKPGRSFGTLAWTLGFLLWAQSTSAQSLIIPPTGGEVGIRGLTIAPIEDLRHPGTSYGSEPCRQTLFHGAYLGANWVSITPFGRIDNLDDADVQHDFEVPADEMEAMIARAVDDAFGLGLKVAIVPHIYVMSGGWRGQIELEDEASWDEWFRSYEAYLMRYARLAEKKGAQMLAIGVEFGSSTNYSEGRWRELIARVRGVYGGQLTYSANWDEIEYVEFWDALDVIGVNAFWPWARKPGDTWEAMANRAAMIADKLEGLSLHWYRPVVFMEFGVKSAVDSAIAPWEWPEHSTDQVYDEYYQEAVYSAVLEQMVQREWFWGFFVWKYFSDMDDDTQEEAWGFSPAGKRAEKYLEDLFRSQWAVEL